MGVQVIFELHRLAPERVVGLVPMLGTAGRALETFYDYAGSPTIFRAIAGVLDRVGDRVHYFVRPVLESPLAWWFAKKAFLVDPYYARQEDMLPYMRHLASLDMRVFIRSVLNAQEHDAWATLPTIRVPTLVVAAERDAFTPMWLSRKIAATIPHAELLVLAEATHTAIIEQPDTINHRLDRFLAERRVFG
jgi:pimeloyl-ACP methyl ester carboxylesterase